MSYNNSNYAGRKRLFSFIEQIDNVQKLNPKSILEIGVGNKFTSTYLKLFFKVLTMDNNEKLAPDIIGSVEKIPIEDNRVDLILCCQVLEHLPFDSFYKALAELYRVSKKYLILSLPDAKRFYKFMFFSKYEYLIPKFRLSYRPIRNPEHYWEINRKGFPEKMIVQTIKKANWKIKDDFRVYNNQGHHFYILEK